MKAAIPLLLLLFATLHAQDKKDAVKAKEPDGIEAQLDEAFRVVPDAKGRPYFPEGEAHFYTKYLAAMKEPSVMDHQAADPAFELRFTWLRCHHDPVVVRVWSDGREQEVRAVRLTGRKDDKPGPIARDVTRKLTADEWSQIVRLSDPANFWNPVTVEEQEIFDNGSDGATWLFEKRTPAKYEALNLWSPKAMIEYLDEWRKQAGEKPPNARDLAPYVQLGEYLLKVTGLTPADAREIY